MGIVIFKSSISTLLWILIPSLIKTLYKLLVIIRSFIYKCRIQVTTLRVTMRMKWDKESRWQSWWPTMWVLEYIQQPTGLDLIIAERWSTRNSLWTTVKYLTKKKKRGFAYMSWRCAILARRRIQQIADVPNY